MKVYGIKNCDTVKKALTWLDDNGIVYEFHDFKKQGVEAGTLTEWVEKVGWEKLVNKKGLTWKKLEPEVQASIISAGPAIQLMQEKTSIIKRPVVERDDALLVGFDVKEFESKLGKREN